MSEELAKNYDPTAVQAEVAGVWENEKSFHAEPSDPGEPYSIVIPPPNVTAALHLGHALNNTLQDILIRRARMQGKNACWLPGTDHAGIATQTVVEKRVMQEEGRKRTDFPRDEFVGKIQAWKDEYEKVILGQLKSMGCSCDWDRTAFTMDESRAKAVREAFFQLFKAGLIYRGKRLVNWDPVTLTALADDEVENEEIDGFFYYLKYPVVENAEGEMRNAESNTSSAFSNPHSAIDFITVATTRPETMLGDSAVAINPTDPRAAALKGKFVKLPIVNRIIPIIEDDYVVKPVQYGGDPADAKAQFATGFLKVTPAHDQNDYEIGQRHNLPVINIMAPDASISDKHGWTDVYDAGFLLGKSREEARKLVVKWFKDQGLLEDQKPYRHSVGHSYRSHVPIEPYLSDQWYCRVTDDRLRGAALRAMKNYPSPLEGEGRVRGESSMDQGDSSSRPSPHPLPPGEGEKITFYPERYAKTYQTWHENIRDWCISRQLWWGHRIPVWRCSNPVPLPWYDETCMASFGIADGNADDETFSNTLEQFVCVAPGHSDIEKKLANLGYVQDPDVLDTWFSSGLWPLSTLGWPDSSLSTLHSPLAKWNPTSVLCTAREIITLWVSRMVMFNEFFLGQIPFKDVFIHAMIQDGEGRKMSKSLGNGVDPLDIISSHGTDAMRFTLTSMATNTQDVRMPVMRDESTGKNTSPKFDLGRNFASKLWNASRFALMQIGESASRQVAGDVVELTLVDRWILTRFNRTVAECDEALANYRFDQYARACYDFFWRDFCDWYVECAKVQFKDESLKASTARVIASVLDGSLRLLHPMIPFITEKIWWKLNEVYPHRGIDGWINRAVNARAKAQGSAVGLSERIITAQWPTVGKFDEQSEAIFAKIQEIITAIRTLRNDYKIEPRKPITVSIKTDPVIAQQIGAIRGAFESLCVCRLAAIGPEVASPENSTLARSPGCEIYAEGLVDESAELLRKTKRREELTKSIAAMKGRLANQGYIAKAPPELVKQTQDQLKSAEVELDSLG